jgi:hypothetical protein
MYGVPHLCEWFGVSEGTCGHGGPIPIVYQAADSVKPALIGTVPQTLSELVGIVS